MAQTHLSAGGLGSGATQPRRGGVAARAGELALLALGAGSNTGGTAPPRCWVERASCSERLLRLVDADANAYRAYLEEKRSADALQRASQTPLEIAAACGDVVRLSVDVEGRATGALLGDVRAARHLASAALGADTPNERLCFADLVGSRDGCRIEIARLRAAVDSR